MRVSIHAPARGATSRGLSCIAPYPSFNPRTREGCDPHRACEAGRVMFQSTHPRGVRRSRRTTKPALDRFQSTHPRGVRHRSLCWLVIWMRVSIHAPARGATWNSIRGQDVSKVSIHAPARGATVDPLAKTLMSISFNPRTREGCDDADRHLNVSQ